MKNNSSIAHLVDHFFRNEFGRSVSFLTSRYGTQILELAEDAVQEALFLAMKTWPFNGTPQNPSGWIITVANNKILDALRRNKKITYIQEIPETEEPAFNYNEDYFNDEIINMMFACCTPKISEEYQIILTLKIIAGLNIKEISSALLKKEETIAKSYTRAKRKFKEENPIMSLPLISEIPLRLSSVLKVIYLLFNEGYKSNSETSLIRTDLCFEAIRLCLLLHKKNETNTDDTRALLALMCFHSSRIDARVDQKGYIVPLEWQDRSLWTKELIDRGNFYLNQVKRNIHENTYFLQAAISGSHCNSPSFDQTPWKVILSLYDSLLRLVPSTIVQMNRIVALQKVHGAQVALNELADFENEPELINNHLLPAIKAELFLDLNDKVQAESALNEALNKTTNNSEIDFLTKKITELQQ